MSEILTKFEKFKPVVEKIPIGQGAIYVLYFPDEVSAENLIKKFWINYTKRTFLAWILMVAHI